MATRLYILLVTKLSLYTSLMSNMQKHCFSPPKVDTSSVLDGGSVEVDCSRKKLAICSLFGLTNIRLDVDNSVLPLPQIYM